MKKRDRSASTIIDRIIAGVGSVTSLIAHTIVFSSFFIAALTGLVSWSNMFLTLTTIVSLEAIYLAILIQLSVNRQAASLIEVEEGMVEMSGELEEIQEDVEGMSENLEEIQGEVKEISGDIDEIQEDVEEISEDIEEIQGEVKEMSGDIDEIQEDVEGMSENIEEIQEDVTEMSEDIGEIQEDVEEISEDKDVSPSTQEIDIQNEPNLSDIKRDVENILKQLERLAQTKK